MGLIKAAAGAAGSTLADQWKEFFYCEAIDNEVLAVKGEKRIGGRSSNKRGSDNIISDGSGIAVADGQCMSSWSRAKLLKSAQNRENLLMIPLQNPVFLQAGSVKESKRPLKQ